MNDSSPTRYAVVDSSADSFADAGSKLSLRLDGPNAEKVKAVTSPNVTWKKELGNLWVGITTVAGIVKPVTLIM